MQELNHTTKQHKICSIREVIYGQVRGRYKKYYAVYAISLYLEWLGKTIEKQQLELELWTRCGENSNSEIILDDLA